MKTDFFFKHITVPVDIQNTIQEKCSKLAKVSDNSAWLECRVEGELPNNQVSVNVKCIEPDQYWIGEGVAENAIAATDQAVDNLLQEVRRSKEKSLKLEREQGRKIKNQLKDLVE